MGWGWALGGGGFCHPHQCPFVWCPRTPAPPLASRTHRTLLRTNATAAAAAAAAAVAAGLGPEWVQAILGRYPTPRHLHRAYRAAEAGPGGARAAEALLAGLKSSAG